MFRPPLNRVKILHEETLGIVEFHEVGRTLLEVLHEIILVVMLYEVGIFYLLVHGNLLHITSLHEVVRKLPQGFTCRYWYDVIHFYLNFDIFCVYVFFSILCPFFT